MLVLAPVLAGVPTAVVPAPLVGSARPWPVLLAPLPFILLPLGADVGKVVCHLLTLPAFPGPASRPALLPLFLLVIVPLPVVAPRPLLALPGSLTRPQRDDVQLVLLPGEELAVHPSGRVVCPDTFLDVFPGFVLELADLLLQLPISSQGTELHELQLLGRDVVQLS